MSQFAKAVVAQQRATAWIAFPASVSILACASIVQVGNMHQFPTVLYAHYAMLDFTRS